ncbi:MAG: pseudaminic acid cytidylyltransferase [Gammaproteobacteria bacterium]|nr:pseudaminic acid cytidylyltransferase [Gammaproteobacteria bacterium]MDH5801222.1 pseudaminic acid cytidylyltransferase [Gammaproteobacteria bacterium]
MNIALIPARGGSKRIPRKNIKDFHGKPIIAWSIQAAIDCSCFDRIIVSTDDEEIALVAQSYGAEVPFIRPHDLSDDYTGTVDVIKHALTWCDDSGISVDYICCIYATAPSLLPEYLKEAYNKLITSGKSYVFPVTTFAFPIQRALRIESSGCVEAIWPENNMIRSQDLEETYHDAGQFYWGTKSAFLNNVTIYSNESIPIVLPRHMVQDLDTLEDWDRAELMFQSMCFKSADS